MKQRRHEWSGPVTCQVCGTIYPPGTAICGNCGRYLIAEFSGDPPDRSHVLRPVVPVIDPTPPPFPPRPV